MKRTLTWVTAGLGGLVLSAGGLVGAPGSTAQPHVCLQVDGHVGMTTVTVDREDNCPPKPPTDPDDPCPGGVGGYRDNGNTQVSFELLVCVRGF